MVYLSPSNHISCRWHRRILVCLVHNQSLQLAKLSAMKMLLLLVFVTQGSVPQIVCYGYIGILHSSLVVFCFSCFWYVAGLRCCIWDRVFLLYVWPVNLAVIRIELSYSLWAISWGFFRPSPPCLRRASICLSASLAWCPTRAGMNWYLMAFSSLVQINHSCPVLFFGNGSIWSIILWWMLSMLLEDLLCMIGEQLKVFYPTHNLGFNELFPKWFCPNYCSKVALTLVCDFDASVFNKFSCRFSLNYCFWLWGWSLQVLDSIQSLVPWPVRSPTNTFQRSDSRAIICKPYLFHIIICSFIA